MASSPPTSPPSKDSPPTPPSSNSTSNSSSPPSPPSSGSSSSPPPPPTPSSSPPPTAPPPKSSTPSSSPPPPEQKSPPPEDGGRNSPPPPTPPAPPPSSAGKSQGSPPSGNNSGPPQSPPSVPSSSSTRTPPSPSSSGALHSPSSSGGGGMLSAPPPPAHKGTSSSHSSGNSPSSSGKSSSSPSPTTMTSATVIGVGASAAFVALVMVVFCVTCVSKKRKRRHEPMQYYADYSSGGPRGGEYYSGPSSWHNNNSHMMKVPPPPGMGMGMPPSGGGGSWGPGPPPMMMSADMSGNFSGGPPLPPPSPGISLGFNKSTFSYDELAAATNGFSQANLLGQGGFGYVHKGVLPNGKEIAVKSLKSGSGQGEREFQAEVEIISRVHHRHLVSLVGYCIAESRRMLVYDFVSNNTMEYHLHGEGRPTMDWPTRLRIALGSAKGLAYLHEDCHPRIIHRDIKAANILLDNNYEAMVADFGLAKLSADNHTHVSTRVMGTFGYLAPEYASSGKLTEKSDVFSFGVMLLELVTGRRPVDTTNTYMEDSLVDWARPIMSQSLEEGNFDELVDPHLEGNYNPHELACMVSCAAASVRHSAKRRPQLSQIVRALEGDAMLDDMNEGMKQGHSAKYSSNGNSSEYDSGLYNADMKKFRKVVMSSQEFDSSNYSGGGGDSREMSQPWKLKPPPPRPNHFS